MGQKGLSYLILPKPHNLNKVKHHTALDYREQTDSTVTTRYRHRYQKIGCINGKVLEQTLQHSNYNTDIYPLPRRYFHSWLRIRIMIKSLYSLL